MCLDTSSAVKLYLLEAAIIEEGAQEANKLVEDAEYIATASITYAQIRAAAATARRLRRIPNDEEYGKVAQAVYEDWITYTLIPVTDRVIRVAGDLADKHGLRGYDAVQLASAIELVNTTPTDIGFSSFDDDLPKAADLQGLTIV